MLKFTLLKIGTAVFLSTLMGGINVLILVFGFGVEPVSWAWIVAGYLAVGGIGISLHAVENWANDRLQSIRDAVSATSAARRFYASQSGQEH